MGCCHFKGLWTGHHAFRSAIAAQEFRNFICCRQGLVLIHANIWPHMHGVILIPRLPFFPPKVLKEWRNVPNIHALFFRTEFTADAFIECDHFSSNCPVYSSFRILFSQFREAWCTAGSSLGCMSCMSVHQSGFINILIRISDRPLSIKYDWSNP